MLRYVRLTDPPTRGRELAATLVVYRIVGNIPAAVGMAIAALFALSSGSAAQDSAPPTPNVVIILADDLGWGDVQAMNPNSSIPTPNINSIAASGMRFTDAHSPSSVCSPTRYGLLTGRYAWRTRLTKGVLYGYDEPLIEPDRPTLGTLLQARGYRTAAIGKWHLGMAMPRLPEGEFEASAGNPGIDFGGVISDSPVDHGFDEFFGLSGSQSSPPYVYIRDDRFTAIPVRVQHSVTRPYESIKAGPLADDFVHEEVQNRLVEEAVAFVDRASQAEQPFFLYLPLTAPHVPILPDGRFRGTTSLGLYGDFVAQLDDAVGQVLSALEEAGELDDTLLVFTSDNGSYMGVTPNGFRDHTDSPWLLWYRRNNHRANGPWRGRKKEILEGGHRVPLLVRWRGVVAAGSETAATVTLTDLYATVADIVGDGALPGVAEDSVSLLPILRGESETRGVPVVHHSTSGMFAVRDGPWKLVLGNGTGDSSGIPFQRPWQLYDLSEDPAEEDNIAEDHPDVVARLEAVFESILRADSHDATLSALSLSGIDIGAFSGDATAYAASVAHVISSTTVTAAASHAGASVSISPGTVVSLAVGANEIAVTVTAEDGTATQTYTVTVTRAAPRLTGRFMSVPEAHSGSGTVVLRILFSEPLPTSFSSFLVGGGDTLQVTNGAVRGARAVDGRGDLWEITLAPSSVADMVVVLPATVDCTMAEAVCTAGGRPLSNRLEAVIPGPALPQVSIGAASSSVTEGASAAFTVALGGAAAQALTVLVGVKEDGSMLAGVAPAAVAFSAGDTSVTLNVPTEADKVVEADSSVTATVTAGSTYTVGTASSASVTVEDDDEAAFTVSADPEAIAEGESATLAVAIANGVTFAGDQTISLAASGTASASDYTGVPATMTLAAGASSATVTLAASEDQEEEEAETVTITAAHNSSSIGSATVTINSISHDATLGALSLSGIEIGAFSGAATAYQASVEHAVATTTVTATATHSAATVLIEPGSEVSLAVGANEIAVTVTAEDGTTTQTYTVTVTRAEALPVVSVAAVEERVTGPIGEFTVSRTGPTAEPLEVQVLFATSRSPRVQTLTVRLLAGRSSVTRRVQTGDNNLVEDDITVTWTLEEGEGYTVSAEHASASVVLEESDIPEFAVSVQPAEIAEGESAVVAVAITNGVRFRQAQTIALAVSGTASASDYTGVPATLTLAARESSVTAELAASADPEEEEAETVTVTASHGGSAIGAATVTIHSVSHDATLGGLSLSGIEIGAFSGAVTSYRASVEHAVATTTVTATATHSAATVSIEPGSEVSLAVGANEIAVTVTAEDGTATQSYTVTVTRAEEPALPVVSVAAVEERVTGPIGEFTVSRTGPTAEPLEVQVLFATSRSPRVRTLTVRLLAGRSSVTRRVQTGDNNLVEDDITVTWTLEEGEGYTVSAEHASASVVLEESDIPEFAVSVQPAEIAEGESATVTVAITNGVRFRQAQTIALAVSGTASTSDYTGVPATLTLAARESSATVTLAAAADQEEEEAETVTVTASHGGTALGSAILTIDSVSHDATLGGLSLSGIEIGAFSGAVTSYEASVEHAVATTTVTATAAHSATTVSIEPGSEVSLAVGANEIAVTVTAEDGTTMQTYTVTVTRAALPEAAIAEGTSPVTEGAAASFTVTLDQAAPEALTVSVSVTESGSVLSGAPPASVAFAKGETSATLIVPTAGDSVAEVDSTVTVTVLSGAGYTVGRASSASVTVEDDDAATFTVSAEPESIAEGEATTLTVAISNGVAFAEDQTISLAASGTASASDYTGVPATLTLAAGASSVTAPLAASEDQEEEEAETVRVTASHGGSAIGSATLTINSVSHDATLGALSLSGIEIGAFSGAVTSYQASVEDAVATTTVTATATHSAATVSIEPGSEVSLAVGANEITITVTAEDGTTTQGYTVTVTRAEEPALPVVSVAAVEERVTGPIGEFTVSRTGPTAEPLELQVLVGTSTTQRVQTLTVRLLAGRSSVTRRVQGGDNKLVEDDITVTWTLQEGEGYRVSAERASAAVVLAESDIPEFAVSVQPAEIAEGGSATVTVAITNGVRFRQAQTIALAVSGTASGSDYTGVPETLALPAYRTKATTATLTATADQEQEADETLTITASHGGSAIGLGDGEDRGRGGAAADGAIRGAGEEA